MTQIIESILNTHGCIGYRIYTTLYIKNGHMDKKRCKIKCINGLFVISGDRAYRGTVGGRGIEGSWISGEYAEIGQYHMYDAR